MAAALFRQAGHPIPRGTASLQSVGMRKENQAWAEDMAMLRKGKAPPGFDYRTTSTRPGETLVALDGATGDVVWEVPFFAEKLNIKMTVGHLRGIDHPPRCCR